MVHNPQALRLSPRHHFLSEVQRSSGGQNTELSFGSCRKPRKTGSRDSGRARREPEVPSFTHCSRLPSFIKIMTKPFLSLTPLLTSSSRSWCAWRLLCPFLDLLSGLSDPKAGRAASCVSSSVSRVGGEGRLVSGFLPLHLHLSLPSKSQLPLTAPPHCQYLNPAPQVPINTQGSWRCRTRVRAVARSPVLPESTPSLVTRCIWTSRYGDLLFCPKAALQVGIG